MAVWPASLKQCPQTWSEQPRDNLIRTGVDVGLGKVRRRYTAAITDVRMTVTMTMADYRTFKAWYLSDIQQGALPFMYKDPVSGNVQQYRLKEPPQEEIIKGRAARISMAWESLP